jgi:hypothetical protein
LTDFSKLRAHASLFGRVIVCTLVVGNVVGLSCNIAGSVLFLRRADSYEQFAYEDITLAVLFNETNTDLQKGIQLSGVFFGFETIMLPRIIIALFAAGAAIVRRIRAAMTAAQTAQRWKPFACVDFVYA